MTGGFVRQEGDVRCPDESLGGTLKSARARVCVAAAAFAVSQLGDSLLTFALVLKSVELGRPSASVLVFLADLLPAIAFGALSGRMIDRLRIRPTVVVGLVIQGVLACILATIASLSVQIVLLFLIASAGLVSSTGSQVVLGRLGEEAGRRWTDSVANFAMTVGTACAPAIGGLTYLAVKVRGTSLIDASTFVVTALAVLVVLPASALPGEQPRCGDTTQCRDRTRRRRARLTAFARATADGILLYRSSSVLRRSMPLILVVIFATCLEGVAGVYYLRSVADGRPSVYGLMLASWSVGATVGSLLTADRIRRNDESAVLGIGAFLIGAGLCVAGGLATPVVVSAAFLVGGLGNGSFNTAIRTVINDGVPAHRRGIAWGTFRTLSSTLIGAGLILGAPGLILPARHTVIIAGILPILMVAVFRRAGTQARAGTGPAEHDA